LYGGTLYAAFGHLILDSGRAYQLLREHRSSDLPIWFHDATPHRHPGSILKLGLVQAWLKQLGLRKRARLIRRPMRARELISCGALYTDRGFASRQLRPACAAALKPRVRSRLETIGPPQRRLVYLSRHKLTVGSTLYPQEAELVERLAGLKHVDVVCPEDLSFEEKLALYRRYEVIAGFPQACMGLKLFVPGEQLAQQVMLVAGARSLSSTWVNIDRAVGWGDAYVDCDPGVPHIVADDPSQPFQRTNPFDPHTVLQAIRSLSGS
ncbi:MAG: glycosyltransferase 61 family protein, partial [Cyanobium sp.]|nr:glycosyltransferase 61 family protein [Cyanobium sp.]